MATVQCPYCKIISPAPDQFLGQSVRCKKCGEKFTAAALSQDLPEPEVLQDGDLGSPGWVSLLLPEDLPEPEVLPEEPPLEVVLPEVPPGETPLPPPLPPVKVDLPEPFILEAPPPKKPPKVPLSGDGKVVTVQARWVGERPAPEQQAGQHRTLVNVVAGLALSLPIAAAGAFVALKVFGK
jgi:hypothetical protein